MLQTRNTIYSKFNWEIIQEVIALLTFLTYTKDFDLGIKRFEELLKNKNPKKKINKVQFFTFFFCNHHIFKQLIASLCHFLYDKLMSFCYIVGIINILEHLFEGYIRISNSLWGRVIKFAGLRPSSYIALTAGCYKSP